jgi:hypothetical protein
MFPDIEWLSENLLIKPVTSTGSRSSEMLSLAPKPRENQPKNWRSDRNIGNMTVSGPGQQNYQLSHTMKEYKGSLTIILQKKT